MAARNRTRAKRRIAARTRANAAALATSAELAAEQPTKRRDARSRTRLEELAARGTISPAQREAGERLLKDYRWADELIGTLVAHYGPWSPRSTGQRDTPGSIDARRRFERALQALGMWLSPIVVHVALCDLAPCSWAEERGKPAKDGIAVLRFALDALADHYRETRREAA